MSRRWLVHRRIAAIAAFAGLMATSTQAISQMAQVVPRAEIARLFYAGRNVDAVQLAKRSAETAPHSERQAAYRVAAQACVTAMDVDCAREVLDAAAPFLNSLLRRRSCCSLRLWLHHAAGVVLRMMTGDYQAKLFRPWISQSPGNPLANPVLFAEPNLLAAKQSRPVFDFDASRDHVDKALISALSLEDERFDAPALSFGLPRSSWKTTRSSTQPG